MAYESQRCPLANALDAACHKQTKAKGFASIMTIGNKAALISKKCCNKGKGKKRVGVAAASVGADDQP